MYIASYPGPHAELPRFACGPGNEARWKVRPERGWIVQIAEARPKYNVRSADQKCTRTNCVRDATEVGRD